MSEIKPGDVVCLKSGSPYMTVLSITDNKADCWHVDTRFSELVKQSDGIPLVVLMKIGPFNLTDIDDNCKMVLNATTLSSKK